MVFRTLLLFPILATFIYSLSSSWGATILPDGFSFKWYWSLLTDPRFIDAFGRSLFICIASSSTSNRTSLTYDFCRVLLLP